MRRRERKGRGEDFERELFSTMTEAFMGRCLIDTRDRPRFFRDFKKLLLQPTEDRSWSFHINKLANPKLWETELPELTKELNRLYGKHKREMLLFSDYLAAHEGLLAYVDLTKGIRGRSPSEQLFGYMASEVQEQLRYGLKYHLDDKLNGMSREELKELLPHITDVDVHAYIESDICYMEANGLDRRTPPDFPLDNDVYLQMVSSDPKASYTRATLHGVEMSAAVDDCVEMSNYFYGKRNGPIELRDHEGTLQMKSFYKKGVEDGLRETWHANGQLRERKHFTDGKVDGLHERWYANSQLEERIYCKDGREDGLLERWYANGQLELRIHYKDGQPDGPQERWYKSGRLMERSYYKTGLREQWYANGQLQCRLHYKDGREDGLSEWWYENGQLEMRQHYKDGREDGLWERWYENGRLMHRTHYKDGQRDGLREEWHTNGQLQHRSHYKDGKLDGSHEEWDSSGWLRSRTHYRKGREDGLHEEWYEDGQLILRVNFKAGVPDGLWEEWRENGLPYLRVNYKDGQRDGPHEEWYKNGQLLSRQHYTDGNPDGLQEMWDENGQLFLRKHCKSGQLDGPHEEWYTNGQPRSRANYKDGRLDGVYEYWQPDGLKCARKVYHEGVDVAKSEVNRMGHPFCVVSEMAFLAYQPVEIGGNRWVQLGLDGRPRLFTEDPSHIRDEVNDIARELAPVLEKKIYVMGKDPSKYIRVRATPSEERTQRSQLSPAEAEKQSRGRKI